MYISMYESDYDDNLSLKIDFGDMGNELGADDLVKDSDRRKNK